MPSINFEQPEKIQLIDRSFWRKFWNKLFKREPQYHVTFLSHGWQYDRLITNEILRLFPVKAIALHEDKVDIMLLEEEDNAIVKGENDEDTDS